MHRYEGFVVAVFHVDSLAELFALSKLIFHGKASFLGCVVIATRMKLGPFSCIFMPKRSTLLGSILGRLVSLLFVVVIILQILCFLLLHSLSLTAVNAAVCFTFDLVGAPRFLLSTEHELTHTT